MAKSKKKKIFTFIGLTILGIIAGIVISFYVMLVLSVPKTDGEISLQGIDNNVEIYYDAKGIPQIFASTEKDAYFALGYQHAADRMFQMDLSRRVASGKLSEILGSVTESIDKEQIKIGHYRMAQKAEKKLSDANRKLMTAYVDGINTYSETCKSLPFEYRFLPVDFVKWTITDCLALLSFQSWYSNSLLNRDSFYTKLVDKVGNEKAKTLLFPYPDHAPTTVMNSDIQSYKQPSQELSEFSYASLSKLEIDKQASFLQKEIATHYFQNGLGSQQMTEASNAWVVAPSRSASGAAMLASDPHLELGRLPQFWYAAGMHIAEGNVDIFGITTAGLPFFVMGHNKNSGWAFTAGGNNIVDYNLIQTRDSCSMYMTDQGWKEFEVVSTTHINSSNENDNIVKTKLSEYGVVLYEKDSTAIVLHWVGHEVDMDNSVSHAFDLIYTSSFEQFQKTVTNIGALDVNYMYADSMGNIGYQVSAPLPVREGAVEKILPSAIGKTIPFVYLPLEQTPHALNPEIGWIANCNNKPDLSANRQGFYFADRILRIQKLLNSQEKFTRDDMLIFQADLTDTYMARLAIEFSKILTPLNDDAAKQMALWDGKSDTSSYCAALSAVYIDELRREVFEDELGDLYKSVPAKWVENFNSVLADGWFDNINTDSIETYSDITQTAMQQALEIVGEKRWGDFQTLQMKHPFSIIPIVGSALGLSTEEIPRGGSRGTLNASFSIKRSDGRYASVAGASMRLLVDFSDLDATTIVLPAGNSGNPMSEHFFDFYDMWKNNERWTVPISSDKIINGAISKLVLLPQD